MKRCGVLRSGVVIAGFSHLVCGADVDRHEEQLPAGSRLVRRAAHPNGVGYPVHPRALLAAGCGKLMLCRRFYLWLCSFQFFPTPYSSYGGN